MLDKISIGTANFNYKYGLSNTLVSKKNINLIFKELKKQKIYNLDTAIDYNIHSRLPKKLNLINWKITSKISNIKNKINNNKKIGTYLTSSIENHIKKLNISKLDVLLLHQTNDILFFKKELYQELKNLKKINLINNFGYSIYDPSVLNELISKYPPDVIQAPFNIFDRRIYSSGWIKRLHNKKIKLQVRSIFLQGLLDSKENQLIRFAKFNKHFKNFNQWLKKNDTNAIDASIAFIKKYDYIDKIVIGCENLEQLRYNIECFRKINMKIPRFLQVNDNKLINPTQW